MGLLVWPDTFYCITAEYLLFVILNLNRSFYLPQTIKTFSRKSWFRLDPGARPAYPPAKRHD